MPCTQKVLVLFFPFLLFVEGYELVIGWPSNKDDDQSVLLLEMVKRDIQLSGNAIYVSDEEQLISIITSIPPVLTDFLHGHIHTSPPSQTTLLFFDVISTKVLINTCLSLIKYNSIQRNCSSQFMI